MSEQSSNEPDKTPHATDRPRRGRLGKVIKRVVLVTLLAVTVTAGVVVYLARSQPAYWQEHQRFLNESTPKQIEKLAEQVDVQLQTLANLGIDEALKQADAAAQAIRSLTDPDDQANADGDDREPAQAKVKPEDVHINVDQTITLTNDQLAAVVQTRMDEWMKDRGYVKPAEITDPMVTVDKGKLVMAFAFEAGGFSSVISGKFDLSIHDNGMAELTMKRFLVGKLPVPANAIGEHLRKESGGDERAAKVGQWLEKLQHLEFKPVIEIENRRRVRVQDYKLLDHGLELTVRVQDHKTYKAMNQALAGVATD